MWRREEGLWVAFGSVMDVSFEGAFDGAVGVSFDDIGEDILN